MGRAVQLNIDWNKIQAERAERERAVFCVPNKYGYEIAVTNKVLGAVYERCKQHFGIKGGPSDKQRKTWEKNVKYILCAAYKQMYKYELVHPVKGTWQVQQLEECVRCMDPEEIFKVLTINGNPFEKEVIKNGTNKNRTTQRKA